MFKNIQLFCSTSYPLYVVRRPTFCIKDISIYLIFSGFVSSKDYLEVANGLPVTFP